VTCRSRPSALSSPARKTGLKRLCVYKAEFWREATVQRTSILSIQINKTREKMIFFWDAEPCTLVGIDRRFWGVTSIIRKMSSSNHFSNVGQFLQYYTAQHRTKTSYSLT
jgi:hypothetical protein